LKLKKINIPSSVDDPWTPFRDAPAMMSIALLAVSGSPLSSSTSLAVSSRASFLAFSCNQNSREMFELRIVFYLEI
jgi:hypothetical protein